MQPTDLDGIQDRNFLQNQGAHMPDDQLQPLPHLLEASIGLIERVYRLRDGLSPVYQKTCAVFLSTFHQASTLRQYISIKWLLNRFKLYCVHIGADRGPAGEEMARKPLLYRYRKGEDMRFTTSYMSLPYLRLTPCVVGFSCLGLAQVDQLGSEVLYREAHTMLQEMEPLYGLIKACPVPLPPSFGNTDVPKAF